MEQNTAEVLSVVINAIGVGILIFVARVIQPMMDAMDPDAFRSFLNALNRQAMRDPFSVTVATLPLIAFILYVACYGVGHLWFIAGFVAWIIGSAITKIVNLPIYNSAARSTSIPPDLLRRQCARLRLGNGLRAWITLISVILMSCQFGVLPVLAVLPASAAISFPLSLMARSFASRQT
ncbi:MAG: hypothetical protein BGN87_14935 [Rhizobiales bacterium 65-79]|jgi:hypothetical protein|nr:hypothetical protein [Hyphomicrobiales bacterium]OJU05286.1 MAG: hypothetical protein BGN87_14935 [Rhizobiales bacterium 65-79]